MAREAFIAKSFKPASLERIVACNEIIARYQKAGLRLTLRQLYYQLVSRNVIPNTEHSYDNLGALISDARLAGLVDWAAIEDRIRRPSAHPEWDTVQDLVADALAQFRLPRWRDQPHYVELWVEKDALAGVLAPLASRYHAVLMVNRGYSSQSAMYEASKRFIHRGRGKRCFLFYLGDHDPSGEDMVRDVNDRLALFGATVQVRKLALTMAQVEQYQPPPNPAKMSDSRAARYVALHGRHSWEVDALPPEVLSEIIIRAFRRVIDWPRMKAVKAREKILKQRLRDAAERIVTEREDEVAGLRPEPEEEPEPAIEREASDESAEAPETPTEEGASEKDPEPNDGGGES